MVATKSFVFTFADVTIREQEFLLVKSGQSHQVEPKAFRVLLILIRNPNKLIPKEELLNSVWGDTAVTENSLARNIALLRRLLGDDPRDPRFIETVSSIGYRFVCPVEVLEEADGDLGGIGRADFSSPNGKVEPAASRGTVVEPDLRPPQVSESRIPAHESRRGSTSSRWWWLIVAGALVIIAAAGYMLRPLPPPRIIAYTQITYDGGTKDLAGTDGARIYFNRENTFTRRFPSQMSISGGVIEDVRIAMPYNVGLEDVSPDGSNLLVVTDEHGAVPQPPQWVVRALDGVPLHALPDGIIGAFSPDGKSVAYSRRDGSIWLVGIDGSDVHKIASPGGLVPWLAWSPDGGRIRFDNGGHLWEVSSNGSNLHQLLPNWHDRTWQCCGRWTADGNFYLFNSSKKGSIVGEIWAMDERQGMLRHPPDEPILLSTGPTCWHAVLPAKDPKTVFANGEIVRGELSRLDPRTHQFQPFLGGISAVGARLSPDGRSVAYVSWMDGFLFRANADGSGPVQLTDTKFNVFLPMWSPDGSKIVFTDTRSDPSAIYIIPSSGGVARKVIPDDPEQESDATWSADGKRIAFGVDVPHDRTKNHIRIVDLDTHQVTELPGSVGMFSPRWSPDGRFISAATYDSLNLKLFDTETQKWITLVEKAFVGYPNWSADSQSLFVYHVDADREAGIYRIRIRNGKLEPMASLEGVHIGGWYFWVGLDATDAPLVMRDIGRHEIYALTLSEK